MWLSAIQKSPCECQRDFGLDQQVGFARHAMAEHQARPAHFNHFGAHREHVVEPRRLVVACLYFKYQKKQTFAIGHLRQVDADLVQHLRAGALHEREVLRVIDHAPRIGVLVIHAHRDVQSLESRSRGAARPKCR